MRALHLAAQALAATLAVTTVCSAQDAPLPPEEVFRYTARADAERVYVDFDVLDDYYLYRARFGFDSGTNGVALGAARFPRGETHTDEFFGEQEIYRGEFAVSIPYRRNGSGHERRPEDRAARLRADVLLSAAGLDGDRHASGAASSSAPAQSTRPRPAICCPSTMRSR